MASSSVSLCLYSDIILSVNTKNVLDAELSLADCKGIQLAITATFLYSMRSCMKMMWWEANHAVEWQSTVAATS